MTTFSFSLHPYSIDASMESNRIGRLVNHSRKNPNARPKLIVRCDGSFYLVLVANQDIQSGEEILYDYGETAKDKLEIFPWLKDS